MNSFFRSYLIIILLILHQNILCQDNITDIECYTVKEGLSQTTINVIFQDSRGYLWVGTQDGLNRYDGYSFKTYSPQAFNKSAISNHFITGIVEDKYGNLWIGTRGGLNKYIVNEDRFINYKHDSKNTFSIASDEVLGLYIDKNENFWIKTSAETIDRLDVASGQFFHYPYYNNIFNFDNEKLSFPIFEDKTGKLWVGTKDGLNFFDRSLLLFDRYAQSDKDAKFLPNDFITSICETQDGIFWVGTKNGLFNFDRIKKSFTRPSFTSKFNGKFIFSLYEDKNGRLWIGSDGGLDFIPLQQQKVEHFNFGDDVKDEINKAQFISIFQDRMGILWAGSNRGLLKINTHPKKFKLLSRKSATPINLSSDEVSSFYKEGENLLWVGTWGGGLNIYNEKSGETKQYNLALISNNENWNYIHSIFRDKAGEYWLGTRDGVLHFNKNTGEAVSLCNKYKVQGCDIIQGNRIDQIVDDALGNLWFASYFGLHKLNSKKNDIESWLHSPDDTLSLPSNIVYCIQKDKNGIFWIGTEKGVVKFDPVTGEILQKSQVSNSSQVFSNSPVFSILLDEQNNVWAGTASGLVKYDSNCRILKYFTETDGLSGNLIYALLKDNANNLWLSTNHGINKFNIQNETVVSYDLADGLQNFEFNIGAYYKDLDGTFYFGGISGINIIRPNSIDRNKVIPPIVLTNIELIDKKGVRRVIQPDDKSLTLDYGTNLLTLEFAALDFSFPYKNHFKYKFYSGEETDWVYFGNKHSATFTNLKPGKYIFKLIGSNSDMLWNEKGLEYEIIILSPFWLTTTAYYLYGFAGILLFFLIYQIRTTQLHNTSKLLKHQEVVAREMLIQKEELSIKNKNITDSINYAKRIQEALMPSEKQIKRAFPKSFVLHKPKDIVSGDFFWISERNDKVFVAAIDCTGHGVPGAFMSIIGYELFRKITYNLSIDSASAMLNSLNQEFESIFKDVENFTLRDGMDIAFVVIDKKDNSLEFSGAINPMYLIRNNKILEVRGSRFSIGLEDDDEREQAFENNVVQLENDDIIYLFSDGYADQFGGPDGKKFKYRRFRHFLLTIHKFPMDEQLQLLEERFESWKGNLEQVDDILVIGIKPFAK